MICEKCSKDIQDNIAFCTYCGEKVKAPSTSKYFCTNCGFDMGVDSKFCANCATPKEQINKPSPVHQNTTQAVQETAQQYNHNHPNQKPKSKKKFIILVILIAILLLFFVRFIGNFKENSDIEKYTMKDAIGNYTIVGFFDENFDLVDEYDDRNSLVQVDPEFALLDNGKISMSEGLDSFYVGTWEFDSNLITMKYSAIPGIVDTSIYGYNLLFEEFKLQSYEAVYQLNRTDYAYVCYQKNPIEKRHYPNSADYANSDSNIITVGEELTDDQLANFISGVKWHEHHYVYPDGTTKEMSSNTVTFDLDTMTGVDTYDKSFDFIWSIENGKVYFDYVSNEEQDDDLYPIDYSFDGTYKYFYLYDEREGGGSAWIYIAK